MEINVSKLQTEISNYNNKVKRYEECMQNLYNVLSQASSYWKDGKTNSFFNNLEIEKRDVVEMVHSLRQLSALYNYIIEKYEKFGRKIKYDLEYRNEINTSFDKLEFKLNGIISQYNKIDLSFDPSEKNLILNEKQKIISIKNNLENLRVEVKKIFDEFEEIEREVNYKISEINIKVIKESNIEDYI